MEEGHLDFVVEKLNEFCNDGGPRRPVHLFVDLREQYILAPEGIVEVREVDTGRKIRTVRGVENIAQAILDHNPGKDIYRLMEGIGQSIPGYQTDAYDPRNPHAFRKREALGVTAELMILLGSAPSASRAVAGCRGVAKSIYVSSTSS